MIDCPVEGIFSILYDIVDSNTEAVVLSDIRRMAEWQRCYPDMHVDKIVSLVNVFGAECEVIDLNYLNVPIETLERYVTALTEHTALYKVIKSAASTHRGENCINAIVQNINDWVESRDVLFMFVDDARYPDDIIVALAQSMVFIRACECKDIDICNHIRTTTNGLVLSHIAMLLSSTDKPIPLDWMREGLYRTPHADVLFRCYVNEPSTDWAQVITPDVSVLAVEVLKERNAYTLGVVNEIVQKYRDVSPKVEYTLTKLANTAEYADLKLYEVYERQCKLYDCAGEELLKHIDTELPVTMRKYQKNWEVARNLRKPVEVCDSIL